MGIDIDSIIGLEPSDEELLALRDDMFKLHLHCHKHRSVVAALPADPDFIPLAFFLRLAEPRQ